MEEVNTNIKHSDKIWVEKITPELVIKAVDKLSSDKNDELIVLNPM